MDQTTDSEGEIECDNEHRQAGKYHGSKIKLRKTFSFFKRERKSKLKVSRISPREMAEIQIRNLPTF